MKFTIYIDQLPPKELSPNARVHYMAKAKATREYREYVRMACLARCQPEEPIEKAVVSLNWLYTDKRARDYDNCLASTKALLDGVVDAGFIRNDDCKHLRLGNLRIILEAICKGVIIEVTEDKEVVE